MNHHVNRHFHHFRKYLKLILWAALAVQIPFTGLSSTSVLVRVGIYQNEPKVYLDAQGRPAGKTKSIPIVAVTSYAMAGDREAVLAAGCEGYIEKPIDPDSFVEQVQKFLPLSQRGASHE